MSQTQPIDKVVGLSCQIVRQLRQIEDIVRNMHTGQPMLGIKNGSVLKELILVPWHEKLIEVISWLDKKHPGQIVFTSGWRPEAGIHGTKPLRAVDLRSSCFSNPHVIEHLINENWDYGKEPYQVCLYHRTATCQNCGRRFEVDVEHGIRSSTQCPECDADWTKLRDNGRHFHIQVRNETRRRLR